MSWKDYINAYTIAGAAAGGYIGHAKYGKKHGYTAPVVGALGGVVAGLIVQRLVGGQPAATQPALPAGAGYPPNWSQMSAQQQAQWIAAQQQQAAQTPGQGEFVDLDGTGGFPPPPPPNASPQQRAEYEAAHAAFEDLGSLSGNSGDGLGSLGGVKGFDGDAIDYDELLGEDGNGNYN